MRRYLIGGLVGLVIGLAGIAGASVVPPQLHGGYPAAIYCGPKALNAKVSVDVLTPTPAGVVSVHRHAFLDQHDSAKLCG